MKIYCCACETEVEPRLTSGKEIYPHREDLYKLPFWKCDTCHNYVGCHHKTDQPTKPLGSIPTYRIREVRKEMHKLIDPLWKTGLITRSELYKKISDKIGRKYHTAEIRSIDEVKIIQEVLKGLL